MPIAKFLASYFFSFCIVSLITFLANFIKELITPTNLVMPYLLGVVSIAVFWGRGPAVFASVLGVIAFDIFLVPPYLTFVVEDTEYVITFLAFFAVGILISNLTAQIKQQIVEARAREAHVSALYTLSHDLAIAYSLDDVVNAILEQISNALGRDVWLYLAKRSAINADETFLFEVKKRDHTAVRAADEAVQFTYQNRAIAGHGTGYFSDLDRIHFPLMTNSGVVGVISISSVGMERASNNQYDNLFEAFANLAALAIERIYLSQQASEAQLLKAKEEVQSALLNSVSHDFRTPLVTITGTLSSLDSESQLLDKETQRSMIRYALNEAEKLNRLVSNLLSMSRLESGGLTLQVEPVDLQDLIGATLQQMGSRVSRKIVVHIPDDLPLISADFVLVGQALLNLLENAIRYSPEGTPIDIFCYCHEGKVSLEVADRGHGIDESEIPNIFQKFYPKKSKTRKSGTGLGLSIVKGILDAHGARINALPREGGGMIFRMQFDQLEVSERTCENVDG